MSAPMLRGYLLQRATSFIDHYFPAVQASQMKASLPEPLRAALLNLKAADWYPREHCIALHRSIASAAGTQDEAFEALVSLGEFMATEATNTYLQLVMRLISPALFCKKVPKFWQRDHSEGEFAVDSADGDARRIEMRLRNVQGFDHVGASAVGFLRFGMKAVGANANIVQDGWSLQAPAPTEIRYQITWS